MYSTLRDRLQRILESDRPDVLAAGLVGLEKESLRVAAEGGISQRPHPRALGSPLTHPYITTDYSEALAELITPPFADPHDALAFLRDTQKFVCENLDDEILWATSMPCILHGAESIPIAEYGGSNAGRMKTVYRRGLGYRYGKVMQVIAGVHFNFSFSDGFWDLYREIEGDRGERRAFVDAAYVGLVRNLQRLGWLIPYLFGASPAVCKTFLEGRPTNLRELDPYTYYLPQATSLRMGDIGYQNSKEKGVGIKADYDSLDSYVSSLGRAIETPSPLWEAIGVRVDGEYRQLNTNILQIENEYYSTVRLKQLTDGFEKPSLALEKRGVRYVELRSLDVNAFHPLGIDHVQLRFLETLMYFCLLHESPCIGVQERREIDQNLAAAAHRGRDPGLNLRRAGHELPLRAWAGELLDAMEGIAGMLDRARGTDEYTGSLREQRALIADPERTPSARMLAEMHEHGEGFYAFANRKSREHFAWLARLDLAPERRRFFEAEAEASWHRQAEIEAGDDCSFEQFLEAYFAQR